MKAKDKYSFRDQVELYFDKALTQDDQEKLMEQVNTDPDANQLFEKERDFRAFIKNNVKRQTVSPDLINLIKDRIKIIE